MTNKPEDSRSLPEDDPRAAIAKLLIKERARASQWENLPKLIKAGRLAKSTGRWYRVIDHSALNQVGELLEGVETAGPGDTISRVELGKPDPKLLAELEALAPKRH